MSTSTVHCEWENQMVMVKTVATKKIELLIVFSAQTCWPEGHMGAASFTTSQHVAFYHSLSQMQHGQGDLNMESNVSAGWDSMGWGLHVCNCPPLVTYIYLSIIACT